MSQHAEKCRTKIACKNYITNLMISTPKKEVLTPFKSPSHEKKHYKKIKTNSSAKDKQKSAQSVHATPKNSTEK